MLISFASAHVFYEPPKTLTKSFYKVSFFYYHIKQITEEALKIDVYRL